MLDIYSVLRLNNIVFDNEKWQCAAFTDLSGFIKSGAYGSFYRVSIDKSMVQNNIEGLFYLLQYLCFQFEKWKPSNEFVLSKQQFIDFVLFEGYLAQRKGVLINSMDFENEIKLLKVIPDLIQPKNVLEVYRFANHWHTNQYTIITHKEIVFMEWGIS